jgi:hypothetical protein
MARLLRLIEAQQLDLEEVPGGVVVLPARAQHRVSAGGGSEEPNFSTSLSTAARSWRCQTWRQLRK